MEFQRNLGECLEKFRRLAIDSQVESFATKEGILLALGGVYQDSENGLSELAEMGDDVDPKLKEKLLGHYTRVITAYSIVEGELRA